MADRGDAHTAIRSGPLTAALGPARAGTELDELGDKLGNQRGGFVGLTTGTIWSRDFIESGPLGSLQVLWRRRSPNRGVTRSAGCRSLSRGVQPDGRPRSNE